VRTERAPGWDWEMRMAASEEEEEAYREAHSAWWRAAEKVRWQPLKEEGWRERQETRSGIWRRVG